MRGQILCVDVDETLTTRNCWTEQECLEATPKMKVIEQVNRFYEKGIVIIHTTRRDSLIPATLKWLRKYGVMFHAISNNKMPTQVGYLDDKALTIDNFLSWEIKKG